MFCRVSNACSKSQLVYLCGLFKTKIYIFLLQMTHMYSHTFQFPVSGFFFCRIFTDFLYPVLVYVFRLFSLQEVFLFTGRSRRSGLASLQLLVRFWFCQGHSFQTEDKQTSDLCYLIFVFLFLSFCFIISTPKLCSAPTNHPSKRMRLKVEQAIILNPSESFAVFFQVSRIIRLLPQKIKGLLIHSL